MKSPDQAKKFALVGVGNPYRHDDAVGLRIVEVISGKLERTDVLLESIAIDIFDLDDLLAEHTGLEKLLLVDAVENDQLPPGTVISFATDDPEVESVAFTSLTHNIGIWDYIEMLQKSKPDSLPSEVRIIGVVAKDISFGEGLSEEVLASLPKVEEVVRFWLAGAEIKGKKW